VIPATPSLLEGRSSPGSVYECASAHLHDSVTLALEIESERSP
jgi:hypothetical protein